MTQEKIVHGNIEKNNNGKWLYNILSKDKVLQGRKLKGRVLNDIPEPKEIMGTLKSEPDFCLKVKPWGYKQHLGFT